jgi:adenylate cyclase
VTSVTLKPRSGWARVRVGLSSVDRAVRTVDTGQLQAIAYSSRVGRSFSFLDLCGFTDFADSEGDEAAVEEARCLRQVVREVAPLFGVRVEKWLGDGVMMVGVEIERLVGAVVAIEQRATAACRLPLRAGLASGFVLLVDGDDYIGRAVNTAARLCDTAGHGQVLAATEGLEIPDWIEASGPTEQRLRGLAEPVTVVELTAALNLPTVLDAPDRPGWSIGTLLEGITRPVRSKLGA